MFSVNWWFLMIRRVSQALAPVLFLPHGGGPLPVLGDKGHEEMVSFLKEIAIELGEPSAILVISAHWEEKQATITSNSQPGIVHDYYGFPAAAYEIQYAAPGNPALANEIYTLLTAHGIPAKLDEQRGFDHGMFIPLKLMFPQARIPCVQLSLLNSMNPRIHIALGKAIAALRNRNILIVGSGMSFHNLKAFFSDMIDGRRENEAFDDWLIETCTDPSILPEVREQRLIEWEKAPFARFCHPREEHLLPLHVCYGIACADTPTAQTVFNGEIMGRKVTSFLW